jgi:hypothetical protein
MHLVRLRIHRQPRHLTIEDHTTLGHSPTAFNGLDTFVQTVTTFDIQLPCHSNREKEVRQAVRKVMCTREGERVCSWSTEELPYPQVGRQT